MHALNKISAAMAVIGVSAAMMISPSIAAATDTSTDSQKNTASSARIDTAKVSSPSSGSTASIASTNDNSAARSIDDIINDSTATDSTTDVSPVTNNVSQKITGDAQTASTLNQLLPTLEYNTDELSATAKKVNAATWKKGEEIDRHTGARLQALLNWSHRSVGPIDGYWGKNTRKAMQAYQKSHNLSVTDSLNEETWQALTASERLMREPVLVNYQLSADDVDIKTTSIPAGAEAKAKLDGMYYERVTESLAEKFHMSEKYLELLNPNASFQAGESITVYNPGNPNTKPVSRVVADKATETLYAYDEDDNLVASYPTTVGSTATPSPSGTHSVNVKVHEPNYTYTHDDGSKSIIPPGPNNPVGVVWIGLSKPSYGIHGSPDPSRISRQASAGCVRLTNWDALALLGTIKDDATVEFN